MTGCTQEKDLHHFRLREFDIISEIAEVNRDPMDSWVKHKKDIAQQLYRSQKSIRSDQKLKLEGQRSMIKELQKVFAQVETWLGSKKWRNGGRVGDRGAALPSMILYL